MDNVTVTGVGVLDKAVTILRSLEGGALSLGGLIEATGLPRATAHRLATSLELHGLVRRDDDGRFALGWQLAALGRAASEGSPLSEAARPALAELLRETGESVQLYVRDGNHRVCIASLESPHGLRTIVPLGAALPMSHGSAGKALSANGNTPPSGWMHTVGEREPGVASVSAPVCGVAGEVVAAVSVSGPIDRMGDSPGDRYGAQVVEAARAIERAAGLS